MPFTVTLNTSVLIQDTSGAAPVTQFSKSATDQKTAQEEFQVLHVTVLAAAVDQAVDLAELDTQSLYIETDNPIKMKIVAAGTDIPIRSVHVSTFGVGDGPAELLLSGNGVTDSQVTIALGSVN